MNKILVLFLLLIPQLSIAEPVEMNSKILTYLDRQAEAIEPAMAWNATNQAEHDAWRPEFRKQLVDLLGQWPEQVEPDVRWDKEDVEETEAFIRRKVYVRTEKDYWAPAYYYTPKNISGKRPAIMCFHGHSGILPYTRQGTDEQIAKGKKLSLDYAPFFAEQGYVVLAVIQPIAMRVWDGMRLLDFLETQDEVDADRIACAGLSGGGTTSLFFAALEDRIKVAMVAGYYCTFRDSIFSIHHCICNTVPGIMNYGEMSDIAALIAPRPTLIISGTEDKIFPIEATKRAYATLEGTYAVLGVSDNLESDFFDGEHQWSNRKTLAFLKQHLDVPAKN